MAHMKKMVSNHKQLTGGIVWIDAVPKNPVSLQTLVYPRSIYLLTDLFSSNSLERS